MSNPSDAEPSDEAVRIADYLFTHVGGDEAEPWQAGHNYAMREAARLVREQNHLLDYGRVMPCCGCGFEGPHNDLGERIECGMCGDSWDLDQRGVFSREGEDD